jgi:ATP-dependent helicase HrpB
MEKISLPIDDAFAAIEAALASHRNLVLVAEPGAGKTTRLPPMLLKSPAFKSSDASKILMLEPRRVAARAAASRIAFENGWRLGEEVGYRVRFENRTSSNTKIEVLTEGLLTRLMQNSPTLNGVGAVIIDEFHERSQHTDLALGLLLEMQQLERLDLRLIVMSATIEAERLAEFLGSCPIVKVPGKLHPVNVHHAKSPLMLSTGPDFIEAVSQTIFDLVDGRKQRSGDILCFLPGTREIRQVRAKVESKIKSRDFSTYELHGSLSLDQQSDALKVAHQGHKLVLSTNIAETSLTIDGVGTVIDSGLARVAHDDALGFSRLDLSRISRASMTQRAGRAGRQGPGECYRLWNKLDENAMPPFDTPELFRISLSDVCLVLISQGISDVGGFSWYDRPPQDKLDQALELLNLLGLRDFTTGRLTPFGELARKLPVSARLAKLVINSHRSGNLKLGCSMAALLSERDPVINLSGLKHRGGIESDVALRIHGLKERDSATFDTFGIQNILRTAGAIENIAVAALKGERPAAVNSAESSHQEDELTRRLLLLSYPDRVARRRQPGSASARMVGGKGLTLSKHSSVETAELFVAIAAGEAPRSDAASSINVSLASSIDESWLAEYFPNEIHRKSVAAWNGEYDTVISQSGTFYRDLNLRELKPAQAAPDEAFEMLIAEAKKRWPLWSSQNDSLKVLDRRLRFLMSNSEFKFSSELERAIDVSITEMFFGKTTLKGIESADIASIVERNLAQENPEIPKLLAQDVPCKMIVPSGSQISIHYPEGQAPFIEVRIQEIFGMLESPLIAGKIPLVLHLLGPNYRPVQVTSDLASFWKTGYLEVRKELRLKYPKHSWPENPFTAKPEAKGRPRRT